MLGEQLEEALNAGAVVPDDAVLLRQAAEELSGVLELLAVGPVEADHDLLYVGYLGELVHDMPEGGAFELAEKGGQDERHRPLSDQRDQLPL